MFNILIESFKIFFRNKQIYVSIFTLLTVPLSLLYFSLSLSAHPLKSQILHLESVAASSATLFEARHVWKESREAAVSLLRIKLLYSLPSYTLSLLAAISSVVSAESGYNRNPITLESAFNAVKSTWTRPLVTSIIVYVILFLYSSVFWVLIRSFGGPGSGLVIWAVGSGLEVYLGSVLGMGLVVSILEKRFGWDAIRLGWGLMEGKRVSGWILSGLLSLVTGLIGWKMEDLKMDSGDLLREARWTAVIVFKGWERLGLIGLYGLVIVWGFVVFTVFYCECRKRQLVREVELEDVERVDV